MFSLARESSAVTTFGWTPAAVAEQPLSIQRMATKLGLPANPGWSAARCRYYELCRACNFATVPPAKVPSTPKTSIHVLGERHSGERASSWGKEGREGEIPAPEMETVMGQQLQGCAGPDLLVLAPG